jgi:hypothetical protein
MNKSFLFSLIIVSFVNAVADEPVVTYGDLYMVDQTHDINGSHRVSLGGGLDTANPMRDIYNIQLNYSYEIYDYFELGLIGKVFSSSPSNLKNRVDQEFDLIGLQVEGQKPIWAGYLNLSVIPIKGRVNFFRKKMIPLAIAVSAGPGVRYTNEQGHLNGWFWSLQNRFYLNSTYSVELNFTQEVEAAFESKEKTTRSQLNMLFGLSF